jgi:hypothetical protein
MRNAVGTNLAGVLNGFSKAYPFASPTQATICLYAVAIKHARGRLAAMRMDQ